MPNSKPGSVTGLGSVPGQGRVSVKAKEINRFAPKKLINSKWTAIQPRNKEKHFIVTKVEFDEAGGVVSCLIQAVLSKRVMPIDWRQLQDTEQWLQGWK